VLTKKNSTSWVGWYGKI